MNKSGKDLLNKVVNYPKGLLAPVDLFNGIGQNVNEKTIHKLISEGFIEEVPTTLNERNYTFYRVSEKGYTLFEPITKKVWIFIRNTKNLTAILSIIATVLSILATIISLTR
jgi:hypothetical protein